MLELAEAVERFNRKERHLLVRRILGHREAPLRLSEQFRQEVSSKLNISIPETVWWAMDYHVSWLAGALAVYLEDESALVSGRINLVCNERKLVEGNQEDIDLLIVSGQHVIMIEAKAYSSWSNRQLASKLERLDLLLTYYDEIKRPDAPIHFHFLLMSPREPKKLEEVRPERLSKIWPALLWIPFEVDASALTVTRCSVGRGPSAEGDHWRVVGRRRTRKAPHPAG